MIPSPRLSRRTTSAVGFTLIEIVLVLVILSILVASVVPVFKGLADERKAREPVRELRLMAREARLLAMREHRPYQVAFSSEGFQLTRHFHPYAEPSEVREFIAQAGESSMAFDANGGERTAQMLEAERRADAGAILTPEEDFAWLRRPERVRAYAFPDGVTAELRFWGEPQRTPLGGNAYRQWVFQPSGLCDPLRVTFISRSREQLVAFNSLTAEIENETSTDK